MIKFDIDDTEYTWETGYNRIWFSSKEKNVKCGDVKFIKNKLFYVSYINDYKQVKYMPIDRDFKLKQNSDGMFQSDYDIDFTIRNNWFQENVLGK